ncbi:cytidylyltransferase domain-containing protein [Paenibacillus sp. GCM10027627]|uniref:acylneuraminate cytidylyltransferase family protein n=1 Tax=unclassified Paenibacillus TaxID=185978 RepID=UPI0036305848
MINGKRVLAVIPARGGSKGVPGKNIRELAGKPLIAWTIEEAHKSKYIDYVAVSSDDQAIMDISRKWGAEVPFTRPSHLAQDDTPGISPILHAIHELPGYDYVVCLQPTSPMRITEDIDRCVEMMLSCSAPSAVSVTEPDKSPYWMFTIDNGFRMQPIMGTTGATRRQDLPNVYALNGAVYVAEVNGLLQSATFLTEETAGYIMPKERSLDIDTMLDFQICEYLLGLKAKVSAPRKVQIDE